MYPCVQRATHSGWEEDGLCRLEFGVFCDVLFFNISMSLVSQFLLDLVHPVLHPSDAGVLHWEELRRSV